MFYDLMYLFLGWLVGFIQVSSSGLFDPKDVACVCSFTDSYHLKLFLTKSWGRKLSGTLISHLNMGVVINSWLSGCLVLAHSRLVIVKVREEVSSLNSVHIFIPC